MDLRTKTSIDFIKEQVELMTPSVVITGSSTVSTGVYLLDIPNTYWLRPEKVVSIDSKDYRIIDFEINVSLTVKEITTGDGIPTVTSFDIPAPNFKGGSPRMIGGEQSKELSAGGKTPMIWVQEVLNETFIKHWRSPWGISSSPKIVFMDEARPENWTSEQFRVNATEPLRQMVELFQEKIRGRRDLFRDVKDYTDIVRADYGLFVKNQGAVESLFAQNLSAIESTFTLEIAKNHCKRAEVLPPPACTLAICDVFAINETTVGANDGSAMVSITGFSTPKNVSYLWTTSDGAFNISGENTKFNPVGLSPGTYNILVIDLNLSGCAVNGNGIVGQGSPSPECNIEITGVVVTNPTTTDGNDATATVTVIGNNGTVNYFFDNGVISVPETTNPATALTAGDWSVAVTDGTDALCIATLPFTIINPLLFAAQFGGSNYLDSYSSSFAFTSSFSIGFWVKLDNANEINYSVLGRSGENVDRGYYVLIDTRTGSNRLLFIMSGDGAALNILTLNQTWVQDVWYRVEVVYDSSTQLMKASVDGGTFATKSHTTGLNASSVNLRLGATETGSNMLEGLLDSVVVYTKARSQAQVAASYDSDNGLSYENEDKVNMQNFYKLNEETGQREDFHGTDFMTDNSGVLRGIGKVLG